MGENFKLYIIEQEFHYICDWSQYKIPVKGDRPVVILVIEDLDYPDCYCCLPLSKDDDKEEKYEKILKKNSDQVHPVFEVNKYKNFLLIQNMFYLKKEFLGRPFIVDGIHVEIKNKTTRRDILKKVKKIDALMKNGKIKFVPREEVYNKQVEYLINKAKLIQMKF